MDKHTAFIKVWMPEALKRVLQDLAEQEDRSTSDYVCRVLEDHVFGFQRRLCNPPTEGAARSRADRHG